MAEVEATPAAEAVVTSAVAAEVTPGAVVDTLAAVEAMVAAAIASSIEYSVEVGFETTFGPDLKGRGFQPRRGPLFSAKRGFQPA